MLVKVEVLYLNKIESGLIYITKKKKNNIYMQIVLL